MWVKCISRFYWPQAGRYVDPGEVVNLRRADADKYIAALCVVPRDAKMRVTVMDKAVHGPEEDK